MTRDETSLAAVDKTFRRWMASPDLGAVRVVIATVVANLVAGDPVWLLLVAPASAGKTELINAMAGVPGCQVAGRVSAAGLLSATATKNKTARATGGLLRQLGDRGMLLIKDFGAVLAMGRDQRAELLQALRDIYDGMYDRRAGTDGGQQLRWTGHAGLIAGTTEAIDDHHAVISALGDRYIFLRLELGEAKQQALRAVEDRGSEVRMRRELGEVVRDFIASVSTDKATSLSENDRDLVADLAAFVARCRATVIRDSRGRDIISVHKPEQPARLAKELGGILVGLRMIGVPEGEAQRLVRRCAIDSVPAIRARIVRTLGAGPMRTATLANALHLPSTSIRRAAEELTAQQVIERVPPEPGDLEVTEKWQLSEWAAGVVKLLLDPPPD